MDWIAIALALALQTSGATPPKATVQDCTPGLDELSARYAKVAAELRAAQPQLDALRAAQRQLVIDLLGEYGASQAFPLWTEIPGARLPLFKDPEGRLCALANLLDRTGASELVDSVARANNGGWLVELQGEPRLLGWMEAHGLTLAELARIQGPGGAGAAPSDVATAPAGPPPAPPAVDNGPAGPSTGGGNSGGRAPVTGGPQPPITGGPAGPKAAETGGAEVSDWVVWWELNKLDWMHGRTVPQEEPAEDRSAVATLGAERSRALALASRELDSDAAPVRAAAAVLAGRLGIETGRLVECFDDPAGGVRHAALLGLGLSPRKDAARELLSVLQDDPKARKISGLARFYAAVGLGLARKQGAPAELDVLMGQFARLENPLYPDQMGALAFARLSPTDTLRQQAVGWLAERKSPQAVRCRAAEALISFGDSGTLRALQDALGDPQLEVRRSAALALGHVPEPLALQALETAADLEREQLTKSYLLLSIGRRGTPEAGEYLRAALKAETGTQRPWVVLALGIQAGLADDSASRKELRNVQSKARGADLTQAAALALGLAKDGAAIGQLEDSLLRSGSDRERHFAALALGLIGGEDALKILRKALPRERSVEARYAIAQGLGLGGDAQDVPALVEALAQSPGVELRVQYAAALGMHGSKAAIEALLKLAEAGKLPQAAQAGALEALGVLLEDGQTYSVGAMARSTNPDAQPDWMAGLWNFLL